jgi:hypothetical protein
MVACRIYILLGIVILKQCNSAPSKQERQENKVFHEHENAWAVPFLLRRGSQYQVAQCQSVMNYAFDTDFSILSVASTSKSGLKYSENEEAEVKGFTVPVILHQ